MALLNTINGAKQASQAAASLIALLKEPYTVVSGCSGSGSAAYGAVRFLLRYTDIIAPDADARGSTVRPCQGEFC